MDEPSVNWDQKRFDDIKGKVVPFLKGIGFNVTGKKK
jgi:translation elongation factor EF-1alpha